jgi:hypothetical protein
VFANGTWFMYKQGEKKLHLYAFEPAEHTTIGELRAMLNRLPDGAAYRQAIEWNSAVLQTANAKTSARG